MEEEKNFKHISIGDDLDDDELIVIGAPTSQDIADGFDNNTEKGAITETAPELQREPVPVAQVKSKNETSHDKKSHEYYETTLEDLEPSEAPLTQKIVVIAAVILIIVAIVYFVIPK